MSAGLAASTVTPGRTAPELSRTTPAIEACANAADGAATSTAITRHHVLTLCITTPVGRLKERVRIVEPAEVESAQKNINSCAVPGRTPGRAGSGDAAGRMKD